MLPIWEPPKIHEGTVLSCLNNSMREFVEGYANSLPQLHASKTIFCFSDYSGEEEQSEYFVYSLLIIAGDDLPDWNKIRARLRNEILSDGRRVSYKNYRDKRSQAYITQYLEIADKLNGYLITIAINKEIISLFEADLSLNLSNPDFAKYSVLTTDTLEKTFRVIHFLGFFVAGLSKEGQNLFWFTDNDKIASNKERLSYLTELFGYITSAYLNHTLGHLRVGTTQSDDGTRWIEDLCSIPDLIAGAYSDQLKNPQSKLSDEFGKIFWINIPDYKSKTKDLHWWLTTSSDKLCKLCFRLEKTDTNTTDVSFYHFRNR